MPIQYFANREITAEQAIALYRKTSLGERRPIDSPEPFEQMLKHANLIVTAWDENRLVGISRTLTDFVYVAYLSDLAVDESYQKQGIGSRLLGLAREHTPTMLYFGAQPGAESLYEENGCRKSLQSYMIERK